MRTRPLSASRSRRAALAVATTAVALAAATLLPAPAHAADSWKVPKNARITFVGHGYGHGKGLSQYGAQGAARKGLGHGKILAFYYPGTKRGTAKGSMRVRLTALTSGVLTVDARSGLRVRDLGAGRGWRLPARGSQWRLRVDGAGRDVVERKRGGSWRHWRTLGGHGQFGAGGKPVTVHTPSGSRAYRGALRLVAPTGSPGREVVNVVGLEAYLRGVVPLEMPASWSPAAVRAQAVAARTYAAFERASVSGRHYDTCDTTACQVYGGKSAEHPASDAAVARTAREIRVHKGAPAFTQFSASSGGWVAPGSMPYLRAKRDPYDKWPGNTVHSWSVRVTDRAIESAYPAIGNLRRIRVTSRDGHGQWGGRVEKVALVGSGGTVRLTGDEVRWEFGLRSNYLTFRVTRR